MSNMRVVHTPMYHEELARMEERKTQINSDINLQYDAMDAERTQITILREQLEAANLRLKLNRLQVKRLKLEMEIVKIDIKVHDLHNS